MIKNEVEIRVAIQAVLVGVLAFNGLWGCALVVLVLLLPWSPFLRVGTYLVQPIVDWRFRKTPDCHEKGLTQVERELDTFLGGPKCEAAAPPPSPAAAIEFSIVPCTINVAEPPAASKVVNLNVEQLPELSLVASNITASVAIPSAISDHVRNLPNGVLSNMDLEVEHVNFDGEIADALVKFRSPNVKELAVRQRYVLRRSGERWEVESRGPALAPPVAAQIGTA